MISVNKDQIISFVLNQVEKGKGYNQIKNSVKEGFNINIPIHHIHKIEIFRENADLKSLSLFNCCEDNRKKKAIKPKKPEPKNLSIPLPRKEKKIPKKSAPKNPICSNVLPLKTPVFSPSVFKCFDKGYSYEYIADYIETKYNIRISLYRMDKVKVKLFDTRAYCNFLFILSRKKQRKKEKMEINNKQKIIKLRESLIKLRMRSAIHPEAKEKIVTEKDLSNPLKPKKPTKTEKRLYCSEKGCSGELITNYSRGEMVCRLCGVVYTDTIIDTGPEWRLYESGNKDKIRIGSPVSMLDYDKGLSTDFDPKKGDGRGSPLTARNRADFMRWRKWNNRNKLSDSDYRNYSTAFNELKKICSQLQLHKAVKEDIAMLYRKLRKRGITNGCKINGMVGACILSICRLRKIPITLDEVLELSQAKSKKEIRSSYNKIKLVMDIPSLEGTDYLARFSNELNLPSVVEDKTRKLVELVDKAGFLIGKNPFGITAACLWIINKKFGKQKNRSMREFAEVCNITEVTARQRRDEIITQFNITFV